jgi:peptidoglycan/LPS O-acetylase OafA/YrhL
MPLIIRQEGDGLRLNEFFNPKHNSLNALRLVFAAAVIVSHSWALGDYGKQPSLGGTTLGTWSVFGFFLISGYLITNSRLMRPVKGYYRARFFRIMPGYLACILVVAFLFAPASLLLGAHGYSVVDAVTYVLRNLLLYPPLLWQHHIGETLVTVPYPDYWNGSLWTLFYEAACYVMIGVLVSVLPRRHLPAAMLAICAIATLGALAGELGAPVPSRIEAALRLVAAFTAGSALMLCGNRIRMNAATLIGSLVCFATTILLDHPVLGMLPAGVLLFWLGMRLPLQKIGQRNDISYGIYIYGWPVQQMIMLVFPNQELPVLVFAGLAVLITIPLAFASWRLVEKPANNFGKTLGKRKTPTPKAPEPAI